ncbi:MAG: hypothetical protein ACRCYR_16875 [Phycicoccus sp.]
MNRTTIAIKAETRARIKAGAESESTTIDVFLQTLLDEHEQSRFWASFDDLTPQSYAAALTGDGDVLDEDYTAEDRTIGTAGRR